MKKILFLFSILFVFTGLIFAGNIANIIAFDTLIGTVGGAALGAALSTPAYLQGGATRSELFLIGAGWGGLIGAGFGLCYSIYHVITYVQEKNYSEKKKSFYGTQNMHLVSNGTNLIFIKKF
ncbi:MAG: hypothetical protein N2114_03010 [Candidatus Goldbacteria bacterium]|nr:hypothetical protein [Candidatus Goldiibacteriota bacterium]